MTKLELSEKSGKISNVKFAYVKLQRGTKKYKSEELEYSVDVVVDKATAKEMKKAFQKNKVKEVETSDFENKYKFAAPYPDQEEQYVLRFKTNVCTNDGKEKPYEWSSRPKVYIPDGNKVKDVTMDVRVANGSSGDIAFNITNGQYGIIHHLSGILIKDMIELENRQPTPFGEVSDVNEEYEEYAEEQDVGF